MTLVLLTIVLVVLAPCEIEKKTITPNTDFPKYYASSADDDGAASPNSLILDSKLKRKIDPKSMFKLKKLK